jgi:membrane associated rhomboid family serine protease
MSIFRGGSVYFFGGPATRTVKTIISICVSLFLLQFISRYLLKNLFIDYFFGLVPSLVTNKLWVWQFVTYMFLHNTTDYPFFPHILFNMLALYMFGNGLERCWGTRFFLKFYFIAGIGAGVISWIVNMDGKIPIIGASGAVYGLLLAYGLTYPNRVILLNFLLPVKGKWLVLIFGGWAFLSSLMHTQNWVSDLAHLSGMVFGYFTLKGKDWWDKYRFFYERQRREQLKRQFEVYYGDVRRKIEQDKKKGPTIH